MRLLGSVAIAAALAAAAVVVLGVADSSAGVRRASQCGLPEYTTGPEVVLGRYTTQTQAERTRSGAVNEGFKNATIELGCNEYRVVLRGFDTWDVGVALQQEASRGFNATLECYAAVDKLGEYEVVFGHGRDRPTAQALADQAVHEGFRAAQLENDPCGGYELMVRVDSFSQAQALAAEAKSVGWSGNIETS